MHDSANRKLHPDRRRLVVVIFDLGLGQRRLLHRRPHHWLRAAIKQPQFGEFQQFAGDLRLRREVHGGVRMIPVAFRPETLEFLTLNVEPFLGVVAAGLAKFRHRHVAFFAALFGEFLFHLPLDRQAVTVPAGHEIGVETSHLFRPDDEVF